MYCQLLKKEVDAYYCVKQCKYRDYAIKNKKTKKKITCMERWMHFRGNEELEQVKKLVKNFGIPRLTAAVWKIAHTVKFAPKTVSGEYLYIDQDGNPRKSEVKGAVIGGHPLVNEEWEEIDKDFIKR